MSRTLDTLHPTLPPPARSAVGPPEPDRPERRRRRLTAIAVALTLAAVAGTVVWLVSRSPDDPVVVTDTVEYLDAVVLEHGVRPLVSDRIDEIGEVESIRVQRTPDPQPATVHLLARSVDERPALLVLVDEQGGDVWPDGELDDGRPFESLVVAGTYVSLATTGAGGEYLRFVGRSLAFDDLVAIAGRTTVGVHGLERRPPGWVEVGEAPMPPWHHGFGTYYELADGRRLGVSVERATPGRETLAAFGPHEPIDLGTDGWAFRERPPSASVLFERGDVVVHLTGEFSDDELVVVAGSLREMEPDEHPILEPDRW